MPPKNAKKITDVTGPGKTAPSATSRPIVTNRPVLASDPMIVEDTKNDEPATAPIVKRTAKIITPVSTDMQPPSEADAAATGQATPNQPAEELEPAAPQTLGTAEPEVPAPQESPKPTPETTPEPTPSEAEQLERDVEAENNSKETKQLEAEQARDAELEQIIASGQYAVPINALQRKRSRVFTAVMCLLALLLALVLLDALLDANVVSLPVHVPHTHLFSGA